MYPKEIKHKYIYICENEKVNDNGRQSRLLCYVISVRLFPFLVGISKQSVWFNVFNLISTKSALIHFFNLSQVVFLFQYLHTFCSFHIQEAPKSQHRFPDLQQLTIESVIPLEKVTAILDFRNYKFCRDYSQCHLWINWFKCEKYFLEEPVSVAAVI